MRLIACHIDNFGKLSNMNINFNDGINIINQPNGWGKSTLAAFLKAMLYGFDTKKEMYMRFYFSLLDHPFSIKLHNAIKDCCSAK